MRARRHHRPDEEPDVDERPGVEWSRVSRLFGSSVGDAAACRCCGLSSHLLANCPYVDGVQP